MTPEDMVRAYDTLVPADVHAVIAYSLRHKSAVRAYLKRRDEDADALRAKMEGERPRVSREQLLARRRAREEDVPISGVAQPRSDIRGYPCTTPAGIHSHP